MIEVLLPVVDSWLSVRLPVDAVTALGVRGVDDLADAVETAQGLMVRDGMPRVERHALTITLLPGTKGKDSIGLELKGGHWVPGRVPLHRRIFDWGGRVTLKELNLRTD